MAGITHIGRPGGHRCYSQVDVLDQDMVTTANRLQLAYDDAEGLGAHWSSACTISEMRLQLTTIGVTN